VGRKMSFKEAIAEMKAASNARLEQEEYLKKINSTVARINNAIRENQLNVQSWKHIESLIELESRVFGLDPEHIRNQLKRM
jgi:hypothetical protein